MDDSYWPMPKNNKCPPRFLKAQKKLQHDEEENADGREAVVPAVEGDHGVEVAETRNEWLWLIVSWPIDRIVRPHWVGGGLLQGDQAGFS